MLKNIHIFMKYFLNIHILKNIHILIFKYSYFYEIVFKKYSPLFNHTINKCT